MELGRFFTFDNVEKTEGLLPTFSKLKDAKKFRILEGAYESFGISVCCTSYVYWNLWILFPDFLNFLSLKLFPWRLRRSEGIVGDTKTVASAQPFVVTMGGPLTTTHLLFKSRESQQIYSYLPNMQIRTERGLNFK